MKKDKPLLERKDFTSYEAYQAYVLAHVEASVKRTNKIIAETNKILLKTAKELASRERRSTLHISILRTFFMAELRYFIDYNTKSPEDYIMMDDEVLFPDTMWRRLHGLKRKYQEFNKGEKIDFVISAMERSCLN